MKKFNNTVAIIRTRLHDDLRKGKCVLEKCYGDDSCIVNYTETIPDFIWDVEYVYMQINKTYGYNITIGYDTYKPYPELDVHGYEESFYSDLEKSKFLDFFPKNKIIESPKIKYGLLENGDTYLKMFIQNTSKDFFNRLNRYLRNEKLNFSLNKCKLINGEIVLSISIDAIYNKYASIINFINFLAFASNGEDYDNYIEFGLF